MPEDANKIAAEVLGRLHDAWNTGDGAAFAAVFTEDAEVINIVGRRIHGRDTTAVHMQRLFDTVYKDTHQSVDEVEVARSITDDVVLVLSTGLLKTLSKPEEPPARGRQTMLLKREPDAWRIWHWHNTHIVDTPHS